MGVHIQSVKIVDGAKHFIMSPLNVRRIQYFNTTVYKKGFVELCIGHVSPRLLPFTKIQSKPVAT